MEEKAFKPFKGAFGRRPILWRFFVNLRFQLKYSLMVIFVTTLITVGFGFLYYKKEMANTEILSIQNEQLLGMIQSEDKTVLFYLVGFILIQAVAIFALGIYYTHRIVGPLVRINRYLKEIKDSGVPHEIAGIRSKDEFQDFYRALFEINRMLIERHETLTTLKVKLKNEIKQLSLTQGQHDHMSKIIDRL